ncbi:hypothetical protein HDU92_001278 [Lobulomyces angularis]|nr:hypothetical protein HDU92_001278 [Lobulomyces angularis]
MSDLLHDLNLVRKLLPDIVRSKYYIRAKKGNFIDLWLTTVQNFQDKECLVMGKKSLSFNDVDRVSNQIANYLLSLGIKPKDTVCIMMENSPEFICTILGVAKVGAIGALLNYNLRDKSLQHCISIVNPVLVIFENPFSSAIQSIHSNLKQTFENLQFTLFNTENDLFNEEGFLINSFLSNKILKSISSRPVKEELRINSHFGEPYMYIYTSGTTGLPKAAVVPHAKAFSAAFLYSSNFSVQSTDRIYNCLPLYHSSGLLIGFGFTVRNGSTMIISKKFSATSFWKECCESKATVVMYIGELARYLLNAFPNDDSAAWVRKNSKVRLAIGNGLRPDIWEQFKSRFNIREIGEFYAATEGNLALFNHNTSVIGAGAVGKQGPLLAKFMGLKLVKFNHDTETPIRGKDGFCIECDANESGELLAPVITGDVSREFKGYLDEKATAKKLIKDVVVKGDTYFRSGDLLKKDLRGFYYFVDRIGDTFRWKGENVSTMEVAEAISKYPGVGEANVYGIQIPGFDGQPPMVSITPRENEKLDLSNLYSFLKPKLPSYALPLFVRIQKRMDITGTFKHQKVELRKQGCDPTKITNEDLFWLNNGTYINFGRNEYLQMMAGKAKL